MGGLEGLDHLADVGTFDRHVGLAGGQSTQGCGDSDGDTHRDLVELVAHPGSGGASDSGDAIWTPRL